MIGTLIEVVLQPVCNASLTSANLYQVEMFLQPFIVQLFSSFICDWNTNWAIFQPALCSDGDGHYSCVT